MKPATLTIAAIAIAAVTLPRPGHATSPFDQRLNSEQQIIHALNRLTFGPRPGDVEEVQRIGPDEMDGIAAASRANYRKPHTRRKTEAARKPAPALARRDREIHA